ncbi:MAG: lysylphosphatidylglycerol synthase transmembrane domain-containing protein [Gammaproteobacteria bacterium]
MKRRFNLLLRSAVTVTLLTLLFRTVDIEKVLDALKAVPTLILVLSALILALQVATGAWRWRIIIRMLKGSCSFPYAFASDLIALLINQLTPSTVVGDTSRILRLRSIGNPWTLSVQSAVLDRLSGVTGLLALASFACFVLPSSYRYIPFAGLAVVVVVLNMDRMIEGLYESVRLRRLSALISDSRRVLMSGRTSAAIFMLSIAVHCCSVMAFYVLGQGFGVHLAFTDFLVAVPLVLLAVSLPLSLGGWGAREAAVVALLGYRGVPKETALAISLAFGCLLMLVSMAGGGGVLLFERRSDGVSSPGENDATAQSHSDSSALQDSEMLTNRAKS